VARSLDIETLIEDAFISLLPTYVDAGVTVERWEDIKDKSLTGVVKVKATIADEQEGTINIMPAFNVLVDFGIFTSKRIDEDAKTGNNIRGDIRNLINQDDIVTVLNTASPGLLIYNNGIIPQGSLDAPDSKVWQKNLSVLVVATTEEVTP